MIESKYALVIGDIILDQYCKGVVRRISPEAPVPVLLEQSLSSAPGGAANVAVNLSVNGQKVSLLSVMGKDKAAEELRELLSASRVSTELLLETERATSTKRRFLAENHQQLLRVDRETVESVTPEMERRLLALLRKEAGRFDIVILSDYQKGLLTESFTREAISIARERGLRVLADVKDANYRKYAGAYLLKPNRAELRTLTKLPTETLTQVRKASEALLRDCACEWVLTTLGADGMALTGRDGTFRHMEADTREVYDVTGAGDTVIAYLAMGLSNGMDMVSTMRLANCAAGCQVTKIGASAVTLSETLSRMGRPERATEKEVRREDLGALRERLAGKKIVFTNGCFDILHAGHVRYLRQAAQLGDVLIVGLNSDASVRRLKGPERPVNAQEDRVMTLSALEFVDYVTVFEEDTPLETIAACRPDTLTKGGDYRAEDVVGNELVQSWGGNVSILPYLPGHSTTGIVSKLKRLEAERNG